jgi:hypothetical protein
MIYSFCTTHTCYPLPVIAYGFKVIENLIGVVKGVDFDLTRSTDSMPTILSVDSQDFRLPIS